jgi:glucokinase
LVLYVKSLKVLYMKEKYACGVDIGGSHITAALIDCTSYQVVQETVVRKRVDSKGTAVQIIEEWAGVLQPLLLEGIPVGIAMPGPFDYEEGVSLMQGQDKYDALYQLNVKRLLSNELSIEPANISLSNDASCFLKGEVAGGALRGVQHALGITLGTGLGTAVYHAPEARDGNLWCSPFKDGMAEDYISSRWCVQQYGTLAGKPVKDVEQLAVLAYAGETAALQVFSEFGENLGLFLAGFIRSEPVEAVVLGGNISKAMDLFMPAVNRVLQEQDITVSIKQSVLGESAALIGAVFL